MKTTLLFLSVFLSATLFGQNVNIPDANFKAYLVGNSEINTNGDTEIQVSEAATFDGLMDCSNGNISDLTGIEAFTGLTALSCAFNQLTSLDVSQNTALVSLNCRFSELTSLNIGQNTALEELICYFNQITSLDVSQNTALEYLDCWQNQLTSLDVSQNTALTYLDCSVNQLTSLDLSHNIDLITLKFHANQLTCLNIANGNNISLDFLFMQHDFFNNYNLTCIEVDDAEWSTDNWTNIWPSWYFSEDCNNDCTASLTELSTSKNLIQILDLMGRETSFKPNTPLIYVYDDGSIEKVFSVEY